MSEEREESEVIDLREQIQQIVDLNREEIAEESRKIEELQREYEADWICTD